MPLAFGDVLTDLKESRYFQVWSIMWVAVSIVFFIGFANVTNTSGANSPTNPYQLYRIYEKDASLSGINFPQIQISTVSNKNSIVAMDCNDASERIIATVNSTLPSGQAAFTVQSQGTLATPALSEFGCLLALSNGNSSNVSTHLRITLLSSQETIYVKSNDIKGYVYFEQTVYSGTPYFNPWFVGNSVSANGSGYALLFFRFADFNVVNYQPTTVYGGWQAYADIGGMIMFAYVMHSLLMLILGTFLNKDSRVLGGARGTYDQVQ